MDGLYGKGFFCFFAPCGKVEAKVDRKHYQNPQTKIDYFYLAALLDLATGVGDRASSPCMQFCVLRNPSLPPSILAHSTPTLIQLVSPVFGFKGTIAIPRKTVYSFEKSLCRKVAVVTLPKMSQLWHFPDRHSSHLPEIIR